MLETIIFFLCFLAVYIVFTREKKIFLINLIGAIVVCYALGVFLGLIAGNQFQFVKNWKLIEIFLMLAFPLLLSETNFENIKKLSIKYLYAFILSLVSLATACLITKFALNFFNRDIDLYIGGAAAIFSGGVANMSAFQQATGMSMNKFNALLISDLIVGSVYLLTCILFLKLYFNSTATKKVENTNSLLPLSQLAIWGCYSIVVLIPCLLISFIFFKRIDQIFIIIFVSILSIILAQKFKFRRPSEVTKVGDFFLLLFCFFAGTQVSIDQSFYDFLSVPMILTIVLAINLILFTILCFFFKLPIKEAITAHIATIYGPPFVLVISKAMGDKTVIPPGITMGSIGLALGTLFGLMIYKFIVLFI